MNAERPSPPGTEHYRSLQILDELSNNDSLTQRDLSGRLGIALGLVNSYIKNLVAKGYLTVKAIPSKRYAYYLTPKGFAEKTKLTYDLLHDYTRVYREARKNLKQLFHELQASGVKKIVFAGSDEVAEIAYITLQETSLELAAVVDTEDTGKDFFGMKVRAFTAIEDTPHDCVVITTYVKKDKVHQELIKNGVKKKDIRSIFP
ncbi:MAG TPA: winged helix-turn-helix transcriptional regulator [Nitrospirota bacterium]|nr:winged helix-turn-helix transcriptional regulator [Nitrospirota bacterium]